LKILFLTHYFPPEGNAPATRVFELTRRWVRAGHAVTVITGVPNVPNGIPYPGYRNRLLQREIHDGIEVRRVWTFLAPNRGTIRRTLNYLSFMLSAILAGLFVPRPDVVIATSPQFFCGWAGVWVSRLRRRPFIVEIRDIWPESIATVGALRQPLLLRFLGWLEKRMYAAARRIVTVGEGYKAQIEARGVSANQLHVITNGVDRQVFSPRPRDEAVRARYGFTPDQFVCAYVGTIGMACGLDVVLRAAQRLKTAGRPDIRFLLAGDGATREDLQKRARDLQLDSVVFTGRLDKEQIPDLLSASEACLVHLKKQDLFTSVFPSKILEAAAMQRPIILGVAGFAAQLVKDAGAGIVIEPEDETQLVQAAEFLADHRDQGLTFGRQGYENIARRFDWDSRAAAYLDLVRDVATGTR